MKERSQQAQAHTDRLFIQEIMNDLVRKGQDNGKAWDLLRDWSAELRERSGLKGRTRRTFHKEIGKQNW
ncbi:MAG: hypothetical protein JST38_03415 [Bacteroidetes bacterium]|nr:hypothetical protein [Bacteroidota bacterium]MBS1944716.1 hypothetical protein [Bacteroidota bacterium]